MIRIEAIFTDASFCGIFIFVAFSKHLSDPHRRLLPKCVLSIAASLLSTSLPSARASHRRLPPSHLPHERRLLPPQCRLPLHAASLHSAASVCQSRLRRKEMRFWCVVSISTGMRVNVALPPKGSAVRVKLGKLHGDEDRRMVSVSRDTNF
jgi:hypothetical protein